MLLNDLLEKSNTMKKASECISKNICSSFVSMGSGEKALLINSLSKQCIVVCSSFVFMSELKLSLSALGKKVGTLTYGYSMPVFSYKEDCQSMYEFLSGLYDFYLGRIDVLLVLAETLLQKLPDISFFENYKTFIKGKDYDFDNLANELIYLGYKRQNLITKKGEFSIRGDIIDIYPINCEMPIRLDFFGDTLEKITEFDIDSMQSVYVLDDEVFVYPATIYIGQDIKKAKELFDNEMRKITLTNENSFKVSDIISTYVQRFENNNLSINDSFILPFFNFNKNILNLFENKIIFFDEPKKIFDDYINIYNNNLESIKSLINKGELTNLHIYFNNLINDLLNIKNYYLFDNFNNNYLQINEIINFRNIGTRKYVFDYNSLVKDINIYLVSNYTVVLFCGSEDSKNSIGEFLIKNKLSYQTEYKENLGKAQLVLTENELTIGASFLECGIVLIGTSELVKRTSKQVVSKNKKRTATFLPKLGEYVVHNIHGIGKCVDIKKLNLNGVDKDYFIVEYKNGDLLYLPSEQVNTISAYLGGEKTPTLNKIGGQEFAKIKEKVKASVKTLAFDLVKLYKDREKQKGFKFDSSNYLMDIFENAFAYELTEDQAQAICDIKSDMYSGKVMDRLICGDVGYGKTEVALRAAYQAVLDGKQVAFLCPTTILSEQHYKTTIERTKDFMCKVAVLNRFKDTAQTKQILKDLKNGDIDIIIGTHRLLNDDVVFKDLGLLILDEEHRFGVESKEKIKNMKKDIDVLTLSATPIPRTLNMAMTGIRDISIIETAPKNRLPVQTYVVEESEAMIVDAIKRELARDGQVLVVYNRVDKIYDFTSKLKDLIPEAKFGVAHGQMQEKLLEDTIMQLYNGEFDVLVATTLIENGIDLPLANTLIVIDSDRLGLSQLYQLKGRIGRSDRLAYAYFTYNPAKVLTEDAYRRLDAILEFTELGSGFKIAMRDLEIRGAGNVLGKEQHGHLGKVGYDLYCKLLEEAVSEAKGRKEKESRPIKIDISCPAFMPENYIQGEEERIKYYSKISDICDKKAYIEVKNNIVEAFGEMPKELVSLLKIALIKNLGEKNDIKRILCTNSETKLYLYPKEEILTEGLSKQITENKQKTVLKFEDVPIIEINLNNIAMGEKLDFLINFLTNSL